MTTEGARMPRVVLGVNSGTHDGSAALTIDDEIVCMVESERLVRNKHAFDHSPAHAINTCLRQAGLGWDELDHVAIGWDVPRFMAARGVEYRTNSFLQWLRDPNADADAVFRGGSGPVEPLDEGAHPPISFVAHHEAHAASGFFRSGLPEAAVIVADGTGELDSVSIWHGRDNALTRLVSWPNRHSLGRYYGIAAEWSGLDYWDAGKFMGLAAYGRAEHFTPLIVTEDGFAFRDQNLVNFPLEQSGPDRSATWLRPRLYDFFAKHSYPFDRGRGDEVMAYIDFAASIQASLEAALLALARLAVAMSGCNAIVLTGGVACNCSANGFLLEQPEFSEVVVPPYPHDAGVSLGAADAYRASTSDCALPLLAEAVTTAALGPTWSVVESSFAPAVRAGCHVERVSSTHLAESVAERIADNAIVCWFQGRAEVGQRALGQRSILCDPRRRANLAKLNELKGRENWRPLAPSVHIDGWSLLFDAPPAPPHKFMLAATTVKFGWRSRIPAVVHIDGSARPQLVDPRNQPLFAGLIAEFWRITGVPAVLNTSFNLAGEPIVHSVADAVDTFVRSRFDVLVVESWVITRPRRPG